MKVLNDYKCPRCRHEEERLTDPTLICRCPKCGGAMRRIVRPPKFHLEPFSGDFPTATRNWERKQYAKVARDEKKTLDHG